MNLETLLLNGTNTVNITDALEAPLLKFKLSILATTVIPENNTLVVSVRKNEEEVKEYYFSLEHPLQFLNGVGDEFVLEPIIKENKVEMKGYVKRNIVDNAIVLTPVIENVDVENIILYEGENTISTNYENSSLELYYPKDCAFVRLFLNNSLFSMHEDNILNLDAIYFKDCFTKIDDKINAAFNKVTMKCFDSENQNFSMDCDGNLVVNTITTRNGSSQSGLSFDDIYPIGSIYLTVNNVNPETLFGGTWEQIAQGRTLVGVNTADTDFNTVKKTGGEKKHQLSVSEMPRHAHKVRYTGNYANGIHGGMSGTSVNADPNYNDLLLAYEGGGQPHNNLQPYYCCYIWCRLS